MANQPRDDSIVVTIGKKPTAVSRVGEPAEDNSRRLRGHVRHQNEKRRSVLSNILRGRVGAAGRGVLRGVGRALMPRTPGAGGFLSAMRTNAIVLAAAMTARIAAGRSTENIGENLKRTLWADKDLDALAHAEARQMMEADPLVKRSMAIGGPPPEVLEVFNYNVKRIRTVLVGKAMMMTDERFMVDTTLFDQASTRIEKALRKAARDLGSNPKVAEVLNELQGMMSRPNH